MTDLNRPIHRSTAARRHEAGKTRNVVVSLAPPASIGFRLAGTRKTYWLDAESAYELAVRAWMNQVEREAKRISKAEGINMKRARSRARKAMR